MQENKTVWAFIKKRGLDLLFVAAVLIFIFSPNAKEWLMQQLLSTGLFNAGIKKEAAAKENATSFPFSFTNANGQRVTTADLKGKVVFINFWASWCPPCRAEMPSLNELYSELKTDNRFVFLSVNEDDDTAKAAMYLQSNHYHIPLYKRIADVPADIFSGTLPTTIVIDKSGKVVLKHEGMADYNTTDFIQQLKELL